MAETPMTPEEVREAREEQMVSGYNPWPVGSVWWHRTNALIRRARMKRDRAQFPRTEDGR